MTAPGAAAGAGDRSRGPGSVPPGSQTWAAFRLAAWFALVTGVGELVVLAIRHFVFGSFVNVSRQVLWMAPLADLLFFLPPAVALALARRAFPRQVTLERAAGFLGFLTAFAILLMFPQLHKLAKLILAAGIAVQVQRNVAKRPAGFLRLSRRSLAPLALGVAVVAGVTQAGRAWAEHRAVAGLADAAPGARNVVLLILDTVRAESLGLHGGERPTTPNLERLAASGVTFDRALSTAPWTLPAHGSAFTGHWAHELAIDWTTPLPEGFPTVAEAFRDRGYRTGGFVANLSYTTRETGLDRGFVHYEDFPVSVGQLALDSSIGRRISRSELVRGLLGIYDNFNRKPAGRVNGDFLAWLDEDPGRPFFAFLNYFDAHEPFLPPEPYDRMFGDPRARRDLTQIRHGQMGARHLRPKDTQTAEETAAELAAYEGAIAYQDSEIQRLVDELERRGLLENTIVVVASDHGEQFGERGFYEHGNTLFSQVLWVPLVIAHAPSVPAGVRVADPVSLRDLPATLVELAGLEGVEFPGGSLSRFWVGADGPMDQEEPLFSTLRPGAPLFTVVADGFHLARTQGRTHLFDFMADPRETRDLSELPEYRETLLHLEEILRRSIPEMDSVLERRQETGAGQQEPKGVGAPRLSGAEAPRTPGRTSLGRARGYGDP